MSDVNNQLACAKVAGKQVDKEEKSEQNIEPTTTLSKSQQKRLKKREKWLARRPLLRKAEKEKLKAKRKTEEEERNKLGLERIRRPGTKLMSESNNNFRVVIDMDFDEFMTDKEVTAGLNQLGRIYSINRHAENPCQLYFTSLKGRLAERCATLNTGYTNWDCNISDLDYLDIFKTDKQSSENLKDSFLNKFVYLTGDAEENLPDLDEILKDETKIFIIGGLVDHNRHKKLCYTRAVERKIPTAKLPIAKYLQLSQRSILSTVAVFEIMLKVLGSHKSWSEALLEGIPKRKIAHVKF